MKGFFERIFGAKNSNSENGDTKKSEVKVNVGLTQDDFIVAIKENDIDTIKKYLQQGGKLNFTTEVHRSICSGAGVGLGDALGDYRIVHLRPIEFAKNDATRDFLRSIGCLSQKDEEILREQLREKEEEIFSKEIALEKIRVEASIIEAKLSR